MPSRGYESGAPEVTSREFFTLATFCYVNIINYMDRFCVAGVLIDIQEDFAIGDDLGGLLQTAFVIAYMLSSMIFGYLGDRYHRRMLLIASVLLWTLMTICGSLANSYSALLLCRALVGVGEAGFSTIAPTVISDIVSEGTRSIVLAVFHLAIPVGAGMGYVVSSKIAKWSGNWRWGLVVTPCFGIVGAFLLYFGSYPARGEKEAATMGGQPLKATEYKKDLVYLARNRSFVLSTGAFTCISFITGALSWWAPKCLYESFQMIPSDIEMDAVVLRLGGITVVTGILGVVLGSTLSKCLRPHYPWVDPIICGIGLAISYPLLMGALWISTSQEGATLLLIFMGQIMLNLNWAICSDILLYVVVPTRRSTAEALRVLVGHSLGDCISPYIAGLLSEYFKKTSIVTKNGWKEVHRSMGQDVTFHPLQLSLLSVTFVELIGSILFFMNGYYVVQDKQNAFQMTIGNE